MKSLVKRRHRSLKSSGRHTDTRLPSGVQINEWTLRTKEASGVS